MKDRDGKDLPGQMNISKALQFQPYCENCFLTPSDNEDHEYRPFNPCQECRLAFFCSDKCLSSGFHEHRRKQCADFQEQGAFEIMEIGHQKRSGEVRLMLPTMRPRNTYKALSTAHSWRQYFQDISGNSLGQCITDDFGPADNDSECLHLGRVLKVAAQASSFILTVLAGLEAEIPDLATRKHLTIHVVGASNIEIEIQRMNEELLHLLPKLQDLIVGYIGPDFPSEGEGSNHLMDIECCPECTSSGRTRRIFVKRRLYHDVVHSQLLAQNPPDLLVAFNSGHAESETKSWAPMLKFILDSGVPAIFTTYNEYEAIQEEQVLDKMGAHFSKRRSKNPWGGVRPYFDTFMERYEKYYQNNYWYIVKGR
ncbi:hypothetical protein MMC28_006650 [Mycoblastus sanguinarius]|nr:hypothetical protein [Mycoblastus sanguinarius]